MCITGQREYYQEIIFVRDPACSRYLVRVGSHPVPNHCWGLAQCTCGGATPPVLPVESR